MSVPAIPPILVVAPALLAIASAQNVQTTVTSQADSGAKSAAASTTGIADRVIRLDDGAPDFGVSRPVAASGGWVNDRVAGPFPVATNAWQLTIR